MKQLKSQTKKARSREVTSTFLSYRPYEKTLPVGTRTTAWVSNEVSKDGRHSVAHTKSYAKVLLPRDDTLKGAKIEIEVTSVDKFHVVADLLKVYFRHSQAPLASHMDEDMPETKGETKKNSKQTKTEGMFVDGDFCADDGGCCGSNEGECCGASACDTPRTVLWTRRRKEGRRRMAGLGIQAYCSPNPACSSRSYDGLLAGELKN